MGICVYMTFCERMDARASSSTKSTTGVVLFYYNETNLNLIYTFRNQGFIFSH